MFKIFVLCQILYIKLAYIKLYILNLLRYPYKINVYILFMPVSRACAIILLLGA